MKELKREYASTSWDFAMETSGAAFSPASPFFTPWEEIESVGEESDDLESVDEESDDVESVGENPVDFEEETK
jgi:hypothetical protein